MKVHWRELPHKKGGSRGTWDSSTAAIIGHRFYLIPCRARPKRLYTLDLNAQKWTEKSTTGDVPRVLGDAAIVAVDDKLVFIETRTKDFWTAKRALVLDIVTNDWSTIKLRGRLPFAYGACLVDYWEAKGSLLILGRRKLKENRFLINLVRVESMEAVGLRVAGELQATPEASGVYRCYSSIFVPDRQRWVVCCGGDRPNLYTIDLGMGLPEWFHVRANSVSSGLYSCSPFLAGSRVLYVGGAVRHQASIKVYDYNLITGKVGEEIVSHGDMPRDYQTMSPTVVPRSTEEFVYITQRTGSAEKTRTFLARITRLPQ